MITPGRAGIPGLGGPERGGGFYPFMNITALLGRKHGTPKAPNSTGRCLVLPEQQNVATVMGSAFGAEGYARVSFATAHHAAATSPAPAGRGTPAGHGAVWHTGARHGVGTHAQR